MLRLSTKPLLSLLILGASLPLAAAPKHLMIPIIPGFKWKLESVAKLRLQDLPKYGDALEVDKEAGVTGASERIYKMGDFQASAVFEEAADPSSAYSLYTLSRQEDMKPAPGIDLAVAGVRQALMARGRYFIRVLRPTDQALTKEGFRSLLIAIGGSRTSAQNIDELPAPLPRRGLEPGSEKYLLGPASATLALPSIPPHLIGFKEGAEAESGTYLVRGGRMLLLQISYPTPQLAAVGFNQLINPLHLNQKDGGRGSIYGRRQGSYVLLVLSSKSKAAVERFLDRFNVSQVVSEVPRYPKPDPFVLQLVELVLANGVLVIIIAGGSILGGITIYLSKQLIMKLFPKSSWVTPDDEILIRLKINLFKS